MAEVTMEKITDLMQKMKTEIIETITKNMEEKIKSIETRTSVIEEKVNENYNLFNDRLTFLEPSETTGKESLKNLIEENKQLKLQIDDQINRSTRSTLVFKGLKEEENEDWETSETILTNLFNRHLNIDNKVTKKMIDRAHRGGKRIDGKPGRPIFVKFNSWKDSQSVLKGFRELCINNNNMKINVSQVYSKDLTKRRNEAMKKRKELLDKKDIISGFVDYPARLMTKTKTGDRYKLHKSF